MYGRVITYCPAELGVIVFFIVSPSESTANGVERALPPPLVAAVSKTTGVVNVNEGTGFETTILTTKLTLLTEIL